MGRIKLNKALVAVFSTGMFVLFEPAPIDLLIIILLFFVLISGRTRWSSSIRTIATLVLAHLFFEMTSMFAAGSPSESLQFLFVTAYLMLSMLILASYIANQGLVVVISMFYGLYIATFITTLAVLLVKLGILPSLGDVVIMYGQTRVRGFFKDTNVMAPAVIPVLLFSIYSINQKTRMRIMHASIALACVALILLSFSRGAVITVLIAIFVYYTLDAIRLGRRGYRRIGMMFFVFSAIAISAVVIIHFGDYGAFFEQRVGLESYDQDRFRVWQILFNRIGDDPVGGGPGSTNGFLYSNYDLAGSNAAHNTYLRIAFENGWGGFITFFVLLAMTFIVSVRQCLIRGASRELSQVAFASYLAVIVSGFTVDTLHWRHLWWVMAVIWGLESIRNVGLTAEIKRTDAGL